MHSLIINIINYIPFLIITIINFLIILSKIGKYVRKEKMKGLFLLINIINF